MGVSAINTYEWVMLNSYVGYVNVNQIHGLSWKIPEKDDSEVRFRVSGHLDMMMGMGQLFFFHMQLFIIHL